MATEIVGEKFTATISQVVQSRLNKDLVAEKLSAEDLAACHKEIEFPMIKSARKEGKKPVFKTPNLSNFTPEGIADMLGDVRERIADLKKEEGVLKEALKARLEVDPSKPKERFDFGDDDE